MVRMYFKLLPVLLLVMAFSVSCSKDAVEEDMPVLELTFDDVSSIAVELYADAWGEIYSRGVVCLSNSFYAPLTPLKIAGFDKGTYKDFTTPDFYSWIMVGGFNPDDTGKYQYWEMILVNAEDKNSPRMVVASSVDQIINLKDFTRIIYRP